MAQGMGEDRIEARLRELGIVLPVLPKAGGNYLSAKTVGKMVYLAGVISSAAAGVITGTVGSTARLTKVTSRREPVC